MGTVRSRDATFCLPIKVSAYLSFSFINFKNTKPLSKYICVGGAVGYSTHMYYLLNNLLVLSR